MNSTTPNDSDNNASKVRVLVYLLLAVLSLSGMVGRILTIGSKNATTPFLCANDRSRWCTIRALGDDGTYEIDKILQAGDLQTQKYWRTIDRVKHTNREGKLKSYSSKPPLLPTMLAGEYWVLKKVAGVSIEERPFYIGRFMLIITNVGLMAFFFWLMADMINRVTQNDWSRIFLMAAATFGTFLSTFAVTLNNHTVAAVSVAVTLWAVLKIWHGERRDAWLFFVAGLAAAFTAANELPALSFLCLIGTALLWKAPLKTVTCFVPGAMVVAAAFFATTMAAHDSWRPPYAHRGVGAEIARIDVGLAEQLSAGEVPVELVDKLKAANVNLASFTTIHPKNGRDGWEVRNDGEQNERYEIVPHIDSLSVHEWDDWYDFEGAYWRSGDEEGVDLGETSRLVYAFHVFIGHHGIFSLTPIWILSVVGLCLWLGQGRTGFRDLAIMILILSGVVISFYLARGLVDRNYGGVTSGFRWVFWFTPMWLLAMAPTLDRMSETRVWRLVAIALLGLSTASAMYACLNPWVNPWMYTYMQYLTLIP